MQPNVETLSFKKLDARAVLPARGSLLSVVSDISAIEDVVIEPKQRAVVEPDSPSQFRKVTTDALRPARASQRRLVSMCSRE